MVVAGLLMFVATYLLLRDRDTTYRVMAATGDIRPGTVVTSDSFSPVDVQLDPSLLDGLLPADQAAARQGWVAANSIAAGELVGREDLREPAAPSNLRAMGIPIPADRAVAGALEAGDRVDVIEVVGGVSSYVAADLEVIAQAEQPDGDALTPGQAEGIIVAVDPEQALALARALSVGELYVLRSTGSSVVQIQPPPPAPLPSLPAPPVDAEPTPAASPQVSAADDEG
jgi:Flp pilus assembly protein CpaB